VISSLTGFVVVETCSLVDRAGSMAGWLCGTVVVVSKVHTGKGS
jgi:hypothetical protein